MTRAALYWHTLRHLRAAQFYYLARFRLLRPRPNLSPPPPLRNGKGSWIAPVADQPSMAGPQIFSFLNEPGSLAKGWDDPGRSKLWRYNLHYFDDLTAQDAAHRRAWHQALIAHWIEHNPPARGTGWEPFAISLRIVNWIKAGLAGLPLEPETRRSLAVQVRFLAQRLERHLSANHLLANAKALCFAGAFFAGKEAGRWFEAGRALLIQELPEQVLRDGGHYELSPMYHALVLEDLLDLVNLLRWSGLDEPVLQGALASRIEPMLGWLAAMSHPDGEIAFFNDAALGIAPNHAALADYAARLDFPAQIHVEQRLLHLHDSGYLRLSIGRAVMLADGAAVGPDHQPGHAHADTLSFELSLDGERLLVNGGTSLYGLGEERLRQRATAAHNTVVVDNANSSEVWSGFRVARRARPTLHHAAEADGAVTIRASHDGYRRLPGRPIHIRTIVLSPRSLTVEDEISGLPRQAEAWFHFAPGITLRPDPDGGSAFRENRRVLRWTCHGGAFQIVSTSHHPHFGEALPTQSIVVTIKANPCRTEFIFEDQ